jgi:uncharacterized phage protein (TIGR01671 family)
MKDIKFRGKPMESGDKRPWVYGYYAEWRQDGCLTEFIFTPDEEWVEIQGGTRGQYTNLHDMTGKEIYEGDIVKGKWNFDTPIKVASSAKNFIKKVKWNEKLAGFEPFCAYDTECNIYFITNECEVIGNIYSNPELLKEKE